jgi:hypothetical protein
MRSAGIATSAIADCHTPVISVCDYISRFLELMVIELSALVIWNATGWNAASAPTPRPAPER